MWTMCLACRMTARYAIPRQQPTENEWSTDDRYAEAPTVDTRSMQRLERGSWANLSLAQWRAETYLFSYFSFHSIHCETSTFSIFSADIVSSSFDLWHPFYKEANCHTLPGTSMFLRIFVGYNTPRVRCSLSVYRANKSYSRHHALATLIPSC
jgi:hypothetical protein